MPVIHDNTIQAYIVDFEMETLHIKTTYHVDNIFEKTTICFSGYLTHIFENEIRGSTIFDVQEYPFELFFKKDFISLEEKKRFGWPIFYETKNELIQYLQTHKYKIFEISPSNGLCGLVFARQMEIVAA